MASPLNVKVAYEELRSIDFDEVGPGYNLVGSVFAHPVRQLIIQNNTDVAFLISYDAITNHSWIGSGERRIVDYGSNMAIPAGYLEQPVGQGVYITSEATDPTEGSVYVEVIYAAGSAS